MSKIEYLSIKTFYKDEKWYINYLQKSFDMDIYFETILKYIGISGWEMITNAKFDGAEPSQIFYFKRETDKHIKFADEKLFSRIDQFTHFASAKLESELDATISDKEASKKLLTYFYDWLKLHYFKWDDPAPGANESHYLSMEEDISKLPIFFDAPEGTQRITTRIDVDRTENALIIRVNKLMPKSDTWRETSNFKFTLDKAGLDRIRYMLGNHYTWINKLNGLDKF